MEGVRYNLRKNLSVLYKENNITTKTGGERREQKKKDDRTKRQSNFDNRREISPDCIEKKPQEQVNEIEVSKIKHSENLKKRQQQRRLAAEQLPRQHTMTTRSMVEKQPKREAEPQNNEAASVPQKKENKGQSKKNPKKVLKVSENSQTDKVSSISESVGDSHQSKTLKTAKNKVKKSSKTKKASKVQEVNSNLPEECDDLSQVDMGTLKIASPTKSSPKTAKLHQSPALKEPEIEVKTPQKPLQSEEAPSAKEINSNSPVDTLKSDPPVQCLPNTAANDFTKVLDNQINDFQSKMSYWENEKNDNLSEDSIGLICMAIGQANLLIANKFKKFRELIQCCHLQNGEKQVTPNDLDGYWALISQEVDNINKRFENLTLLKNNMWVEIVLPKKVKKVSKKNKPKLVKKPTASFAVREAIRAARMKRKNSVVEVEAVKENDNPQLLRVVKSSTGLVVASMLFYLMMNTM